jgi:hypothetical protein
MTFLHEADRPLRCLWHTPLIIALTVVQRGLFFHRSMYQPIKLHIARGKLPGQEKAVAVGLPLFYFFFHFHHHESLAESKRPVRSIFYW